MPDGTQIIVRGANVHPDSGHVSVKVQSVTTNGDQSWQGPTKTYGVDANMFKGRFNSDIDQVLQWVKSEHLGYHGAHQGLIDGLNAKVGTVIG